MAYYSMLFGISPARDGAVRLRIWHSLVGAAVGSQVALAVTVVDEGEALVLVLVAQRAALLERVDHAIGAAHTDAADAHRTIEKAVLLTREARCKQRCPRAARGSRT